MKYVIKFWIHPIDVRWTNTVQCSMCYAVHGTQGAWCVRCSHRHRRHKANFWINQLAYFRLMKPVCSRSVYLCVCVSNGNGWTNYFVPNTHTNIQSASARATWMFGSAEKASPYFYVYFVYSNEADFFRLSLAIWCKSNGRNSSPTLVSIKSHSEKLSSNACKYVRSHRIWSTRTSLAAAAIYYRL